MISGAYIVWSSDYEDSVGCSKVALPRLELV